MSNSKDSEAVEQVMRLMLASSCFGREVCPVPPCACAQSIVEAVRKQTIEECAKVADEWLAQCGEYAPQYVSAQKWANDAVSDIAVAIRALPPHPPAAR